MLARDSLNRQLMNLYRLYMSRFPETRFIDILKARYNVSETRLMTVEQLQDLVKSMEQKLATK